MKRTLILLTLCAALCSCETTRITSMRDPASRGMKFNKVYVKADYSDFDMVRKVEGSAVRNLWLNGVQCVANNVVLPPLREYSKADREKAVHDQEADALLLITPNGASTLSVTDVYANTYSASATSHESLSGVNTDLQLYDVASGKLIWRGQAKSTIPHDAHGNAWGSLDGVIKSVAKEAVSVLDQEQLFIHLPQHVVDSIDARYQLESE